MPKKSKKVTKNNKTKIVMVLDRSGSMHSLISDTVGGFNRFIEDQKNDDSDETVVSLIQFNSNVEKTFINKPVSDVPVLDEDNYKTYGSTALLDALGNAILESKKDLEKDEMVIIVVITDGQENCSREYTNESIKKLVADCENNLGWSFIYLGANVDAFSEAGKMGFSLDTVSGYNTKNMRGAYDTISYNVKQYRNTRNVDSLSFTDDQRHELDD